MLSCFAHHYTLDDDSECPMDIFPLLYVMSWISKIPPTTTDGQLFSVSYPLSPALTAPIWASDLFVTPSLSCVIQSCMENSSVYHTLYLSCLHHYLRATVLSVMFVLYLHMKYTVEIVPLYMYIAWFLLFNSSPICKKCCRVLHTITLWWWFGMPNWHFSFIIYCELNFQNSPNHYLFGSCFLCHTLSRLPWLLLYGHLICLSHHPSPVFASPIWAPVLSVTSSLSPVSTTT